MVLVVRLVVLIAAQVVVSVVSLVEVGSDDTQVNQCRSPLLHVLKSVSDVVYHFSVSFYELL